MPRPKKKQVEENIVDIDSPLAFFKSISAKSRERYGEELVSTASRMDEKFKYLEVPDIIFQHALGRKGFALGKIAYIMGFEGSSKTSFALWLAGLAQSSGGIASMVETEKAISGFHAQHYLPKPDEFQILTPTTIEQALEMTLSQLSLFEEADPLGKFPKVLILDSIAGSTDERSLESIEEVTVSKVGGISKILKDETNKIKSLLEKTNTLWVVLNQGRDYIDTSGFGGRVPDVDRIVGTGGRALPFSSSYYIILKKQAGVKDANGEQLGFKVKATFKKNKLRNPGKEVFYHVKYGENFDFKEETIASLLMGEVLGMEKVGRRYACPGAGITKENPLTLEEMYTHIHSPGVIELFQDELDIVRDDVIVKFVAQKKESTPTEDQTSDE
jgi:RecA/RadA recombinase